MMPVPPPTRGSFIKKSTQQQQQQQRPKRLYYPSIFRYTCRGALSLSSQNVGSAGTCRGLQSRLSHVRDMHPSSREEATRAFTSVATQEYVEPSPSQVPENLDAPQVEKVASLLQTQALIYPEHSENESVLPQESGTPWHEWSCYGSTEVHLLVLRDVQTHKEDIAGVAPECRLGVSVRDIGTPADGGGVVATVRVGPLEVNLVGDYYNHPEEENNEHAHVQPIQEKKHETKNVLRRYTSSSSSKQDEHPEGALNRFSRASQKVLRNMYSNATFLQQELSDNFPSRVYSASERVVGQFGKTMDRTTNLMVSVYKMWRNDPRDDDDDGGEH